MPAQINRTFDATLDALEPVREMVTEACAQAGMDKKKTYGLCLAIDEIATNIIKHGYEENNIADGKMQVEIAIDDRQVAVVLKDTAAAFDPLAHAVPDEQALSKSLEDRPIGGLGVMIARQSVDKFEYDYIDNNNVNSFVVYRSQAGA